jgi:hypothetical protein
VSWPSAGFALLFAATLAGLWRRRQNPWTETLLIALAGVFAAYSERTVPLAAAMLAPLAAGPLQALLGRRMPVGRREAGAVLLGAALTVATIAVTVPHTADDPIAMPSWADPSLATLPAGTTVLDDWSFGGYLMWRYPRLDLVMHGYGDTFTTAELDRNTRLTEVSPGWEQDLRGTGARLALLRPSDWLAFRLVAQEGWSVVHRSDTVELLRAPRHWRTSAG